MLYYPTPEHADTIVPGGEGLYRPLRIKGMKMSIIVARPGWTTGVGLRSVDDFS
jgi:hypothetical protein